MASTTQLSFIKKSYNSIAAAKSAATTGSIVFDSTHKVICVDGQAYGGNITDATFANSVLTITKSVGDAIEIDFSDIASAKATMSVFQQLYDTIGLTAVGSDSGLDYSGTNYLKELGTAGKPDKNLVNADKLLDTKIKGVNDKISAMNGTAGIASVDANGVVTLKAGITQIDGKIGNNSNDDIELAKVATTGKAVDVSFTTYIPDGLGSGEGIDAPNVQDAIEQIVDEIIKNEQVTTAAFEAVQDAVGLGENLNYEAPSGTQYIGDSTSVKDALKKLDTAISDTVSGGVTDVKINGTSIKANNEANIAVDGTYNATSNKIATKQTVTDAINNLDVAGFAQASVDTATAGETKLTINGIKEEDGKISTDSSTKTDIVIDGTYNATTNKIATENTIKTKIEELDGTAVIASETNGVVTIKAGVTETDGKISNSTGADITLKKIATTGKAEDVAIVDSNNRITATDVEGALDELAEAIEKLKGEFDTVVSTNAADTPAGVKWNDGTSDITGTLAASATTWHKVYLVPNSGTTPNQYSEYVTRRINNGTKESPNYTYTWEKLGDLEVDLTGYVKTITVNGQTYAVTGTGTNIELPEVITSVNGETAITGGNSDFVAVAATTGTAASGSKNVTLSSTVKIQSVSTADTTNNGLAAAKDVKDYVDEKAEVVNSNPTIVVNDANASQIGTIGGTALTAKVALYWDEWEV